MAKEMLKYVANRKLVNVLQGDKIIILIFIFFISQKYVNINIISEYLGSNQIERSNTSVF